MASRLSEWKHRDFELDQDECPHESRRGEPSRRNRVWIRCVDCGLILDEQKRCYVLNADATRCLWGVAGLSFCEAHSRS